MSTLELGRMMSQNRKEEPRDGLSRGALLFCERTSIARQGFINVLYTKFII